MNKFVLMITTYLIFNITYASTISGVVEIEGKVPTGVLFIFAKKYKSRMPMPLAVKKLVNPKFPVKFSLSQKDAMMKQIPFKGPFQVVARISPSGNAMDKSGIQVLTTKPIKLGDKDIKLILKK